MPIDYNFRLMVLPGVGELQAHSLGAASVFSGNTPSGFLLESLGRVGQFYQGRPRTAREWERIIRTVPGQSGEYRTPPIFDTTGGQDTPEGAPITPQSPGVPQAPPRGLPGLPEGAPGQSARPGEAGYCSPLDLPCWMARATGLSDGKDAMKRAGIIALAVILLIIGLLSLR